MTTKIEWADETINPMVGCSHLSPACDNCYAARMAVRHGGNPSLPWYNGVAEMTPQGPRWCGDVRWVEHVLPKAALRLATVKKPLRIFHCSMSDIAHESATVQHLANVLAFAMAFPLHTHMLLTKRPHLLKERLEALQGPGMDDVWDAARKPLYDAFKRASWALTKRNGTRSTPRERALLHKAEYVGMMCADPRLPLPNVWLGATIWDQPSADRAVPTLLSTPAAKRFVSVEPMLGPVDLRWAMALGWDGDIRNRRPAPRLSWVICGGETGPGARPMHPDWPRKLRDDCQAAGVPFMFKQWGEWGPTHENGHGPVWWSFENYQHYCNKAHTHMSKGDKLICPDGHVPTDGREDGKSYPMYPTRRIGKAKAGRVLDGLEWSEVPHV